MSKNKGFSINKALGIDIPDTETFTPSVTTKLKGQPVSISRGRGTSFFNEDKHPRDPNNGRFIKK